jgi:succinyl-CoA synthetase beta subunit
MPESLLKSEYVEKIVIVTSYRFDIEDTFFKSETSIKIINQQCSEFFGITDDELKELAKRLKIEKSTIEKARDFYQGFNFN